jgi:hypothetical protein
MYRKPPRRSPPTAPPITIAFATIAQNVFMPAS